MQAVSARDPDEAMVKGRRVQAAVLHAIHAGPNSRGVAGVYTPGCLAGFLAAGGDQGRQNDGDKDANPSEI